MITEEFKKAYKALNKEQKEAVDTIEGPVMVIAGPGTGKTQVLTLRIANILIKTDTRPENILALTFTEAATGNMRKRLAELIGTSAYRVRIQTFHSFCNDILQSYPEYFPQIVGAKSITEVEASSIIEEIVKNSDLAILKPWGEPIFYVGDILKKIEELKREGLEAEKFKKITERASKDYANRQDLYHEKGAYKGKMKSEHIEYLRRIEKNKELAFVYGEYQKALFKSRLYDYSDMILEVLKALQNKKLKDLKSTLQEEHQYILIDEHQDTNNAQNKILEHILDFHQSPNIFVVGDHKQAIFRFQGASVENFLYFKKLYPRAVLIELFQNYRSSQTILDVAHSIISSKTPLVSRTPLATPKSLNLKGNKVSRTPLARIGVAEFIDANFENHWVAEKIGEQIKQENKEGNIAVIYRSNREAFPIALSLRKAGVEFVIESDEDLLNDKYVMKFLSIIYAVNNYGDPTYLLPALHVSELGLDVLEVFKMVLEANKTKKSLYEVLPQEFAEKLKNWAIKSKEETLREFLVSVFKDSGLIYAMLKSKDANAFLGIERLLEESRKLKGLPQFIKYIDTLKAHNLFIKRPKPESKDGASTVRLMTAHKSKGLEFDSVFIINAGEKSFGSKVHREVLPLIKEVYTKTEDETDDERRLFYVSLTRAKKNIFITYHTRDEDGKEVLPTSFISEIKEDLKEYIDAKKFEEKIAKNKEVLFGENKTSEKQDINKEFVEKLFYSRGFSVTALNNYLDCPWKYFYRNLVRIPEIQEKYLIYGTAMHSAVEEFFREKSKKSATKLPFLLDSFQRHLDDSSLRGTELKDALRRGRKSLSAWYKERSGSWILPYKLEKNVVGVLLGKTMLSGKLDKIEFISKNKVIVTDYKTGKPKSRNEIEGKTRYGTGDMKRQLVFYKLLLELLGTVEMEHGVIEFLEPNESAKIKREEFEITNTEVTELKNLITKTEKEITSLSFWNQKCDDKECKYCAYRKLLEK